MKVFINYEGENLEVYMDQIPGKGDFIAGVFIAHALQSRIFGSELETLQNLDFPVEKVIWSGFSLNEQYVFIELGVGVP